MTQHLVLIGAGGHAKVVVELVRAAGGMEIVGCVDDGDVASEVLGLPVLGPEARLPALRAAGVGLAFPAFGANAARARAAARLRAMGFGLPALVHPAAIVSPSAVLEAGCVVMARACVGPSARIGEVAIVNTGAIVEHDCEVGMAAHVAPGAVLSGGVRVGARALVGAGAACAPMARIGADAVVGAGAAVLGEVPDGARYGGVPARPLG